MERPANSPSSWPTHGNARGLAGGCWSSSSTWRARAGSRRWSGTFSPRTSRCSPFAANSDSGFPTTRTTWPSSARRSSWARVGAASEARAHIGSPSTRSNVYWRLPMVSKERTDEGSKKIDLEKVAQLVDALERDLAKVQSGSRDVQLLRDEVETLKNVLNSPIRRHHWVREGLHGMRQAIENGLETVVADGVKAGNISLRSEEFWECDPAAGIPWRASKATPWKTLAKSVSIPFLQIIRASGKHAIAHERVLFGQIFFQNTWMEHVVRVSLGEILPRVYARVIRHARRARENFRDPAFLHPAADHQEKHEMADLVMKHLEKHGAAVETVNENPSLALDELAFRLASEKPVAEKPACGRRVFRQIRDLAQAFQVETREQIDRAHDVVDRNDVLPGETRQQEIQLAPARRFLRGGPILDEQAHFRLS